MIKPMLAAIAAVLAGALLAAFGLTWRAVGLLVAPAVLRLIAQGLPYKEVARRLDIAPKTVEGHVSSVLRKLQLSTRHELTRWAWDRLDD
jgi:hypothetical protein